MADEEQGKKTGEESEEKPAGAAGEEKGAESREGADKGADGGSAGVTDSHGQPGINKERHDKEVAELKAEIAKLKAEAADAAEAKSKREEYEKKVADLEAKMADTEVAHKLELAGCLSVKAAKALLGDFDGDVAKLKAECPYLFGQKKTGTTELRPKGAASGPAKTIREALKG